MTSRSPRLNLPYIMPSQAQKHVTHNEAIRRLDALAHVAVEALAENTPPVSPSEGDAYVVGGAPTGEWSEHAGALAVFSAGAWLFQAPSDGLVLWDKSSNALRVFSNGAFSTISQDTFETLGVNTTADSVSRLAVSSKATLLTHDGDDHQLKVNKAATGDTASLLFQTNWTGHAEMGLAGNNDWSIKTSLDGSTWTEALKLDSSSGLASGAAVQSSADDATSGRLLKITGAQGAFGLGATQALDTTDVDAIAITGLYRTIASTTNGPLSGASHNLWHNQFDANNCTQVFISGTTNAAFIRRKTNGAWLSWTSLVPERGSNSNGHYTRFADGTQICGFRVAVSPTANSVTQTTFTFPAAFASPSSATGEIFISALPVTSVPQTAVGTTGFTGLSSTGGTLRTYRDNTVSTSYSCLAFGRWF